MSKRKKLNPFSNIRLNNGWLRSTRRSHRITIFGEHIKNRIAYEKPTRISLDFAQENNKVTISKNCSAVYCVVVLFGVLFEVSVLKSFALIHYGRNCENRVCLQIIAKNSNELNNTVLHWFRCDYNFYWMLLHCDSTRSSIISLEQCSINSNTRVTRQWRHHTSDENLFLNLFAFQCCVVYIIIRAPSLIFIQMYLLRADSCICNTWGRAYRSAVFGIETSFCHVWTFVRGMCACVAFACVCMPVGVYIGVHVRCLICWIMCWQQ